ncbi:DUF4383 domain-containing protein [Quadrisphaera sp. KR29]|uniref:DUF4383 domain-containing protein n=1 Tax=Quadrisphaera sp. KR29 TaxID=3461391 RepID=UPI004044B3A1
MPPRARQRLLAQARGAPRSWSGVQHALLHLRGGPRVLDRRHRRVPQRRAPAVRGGGPGRVTHARRCRGLPHRRPDLRRPVLYGLVVDQSSAADVVPLDTADDWLHLVLAVGVDALGVVLGRRAGHGRV